MAKRDIIKIDREKCNGCGKCINACAEGAIQMIDGKAQLVSEIYCDGLGACIGSCPQDAIKIEKRQAKEFDEQATQKYLQEKKMKDQEEKPQFGCPGLMAKKFTPKKTEDDFFTSGGSQLGQWPVQLKLVPINAEYFKNADLMLVADCVAYAMGNFHDKLLKDKAIAIACPKLDDKTPYVDKLASIIKENDLKSFTVVRMEVPCCSSLTAIAKAAAQKAQTDLEVKELTISLQGDIIE